MYFFIIYTRNGGFKLLSFHLFVVGWKSFLTRSQLVIIPSCSISLPPACLAPRVSPLDRKSLHWLTLHEQPPSISHTRALCSCSTACFITDRFVSCQEVRLEWGASTCCFAAARSLSLLNPEVAGLTMSVWLKRLVCSGSTGGCSWVRPG